MKDIDILGIDLTTCKLIHRGKKELIYLTPSKTIVKFCKNIDECRREYLILKYCEGNKYFPKVYSYRTGYIIREYVDGACLIDYIKKNGLDETLALSLIDLIENFQLLGFSRLDTGISHIFINKGRELKVIGLKNSYSRKEKYPKHMISGLRKLKASKKFFKILKQLRPELYEKWKK
ncbi:serine/threonine protein kinase [Clostridium bovifaecis]|uniref:Serine/threonine protein kinase n=1 Tax=Clostridium bovifaecis TaxID=2184719 RepID=A0A6I6F2I4_9CLOT|nr:serine/threonine protein kinase [Clostridium bovifaecis]